MNRRNRISNERMDITAARQGEETYITRIEGPRLGNRAEWVKSSHAKGLDLRSLIRGSGFRVRQIFHLVGLDPSDHVELVAELESYRTNLLNHRD